MTEQTGGSRISSQTSSFDELNRVLDALRAAELKPSLGLTVVAGRKLLGETPGNTCQAAESADGGPNGTTDEPLLRSRWVTKPGFGRGERSRGSC